MFIPPGPPGTPPGPAVRLQASRQRLDALAPDDEELWGDALLIQGQDTRLQPLAAARKLLSIGWWIEMFFFGLFSSTISEVQTGILWLFWNYDFDGSNLN